MDFLDGVIGVVFSGVGDSKRIAFVEYYYAVDYIQGSANFEYFPVIAHELSHTFGYPDIYYGVNFPRSFCTTCRYYGYTGNSTSRQSCSGIPRVLGYWAYFDEINGGLIMLGGYNETRDIMACGGGRQNWAYHSWSKVAEVCSAHSDPPEGLLISLLIFRNGTVIGGPFTRIFNHSQLKVS